jgi:hypothetical protein
MSLSPSTGVISSPRVGGQGMYTFQIQVTDSARPANSAARKFTIDVTADNRLGGLYFPANSIFTGQKIGALPVDRSPAAQIPSKYQNAPLWPYFGDGYNNFPTGIPFIRVPYNQPLVTVTIEGYPPAAGQSDPFPAGSRRYTYPIPPNAPIEGTANSGGDRHLCVYQEAGGGQPARLFELWKAKKKGVRTWSAAFGCWWQLDSNALRPNGWTSSDAAGLPVAPLLVNYDEAMSSAGIRHPLRYTQDQALAYYVWPARHASYGKGACTEKNKILPACTEISESESPTACTWGAPFGEIYRLKANVDISKFCPRTTHPQGYAILTALKTYGMIVADNGGTGLVGTPDARWNNDDLYCLRSLTLSNFEPVNVSSLRLAPDKCTVSSTGSGKRGRAWRGNVYRTGR